ncbi:Protein of unknown function DUF2305 [Cynara cardunculus var. scolymus]|uniref:AB hydrolase-1 domain-containing protein n=1 Tax=Cynara cardunculus var. scolymus TaxID=59895 RepID=A0A103XH51_CYNCS|nr:Protein of unknown function DUF2305 [Cynara cardunculus var. scolymus]
MFIHLPLPLLSSSLRILSFPPPFRFSRYSTVIPTISQMSHEKSQLISQKSNGIANFRLCNVSGTVGRRNWWRFMPEIPDCMFYLFLEIQDWEHRKLFTLKEQIDHKIDFIQQELQALEVPLVVVSHSIGSFMSLEIIKRIPEKVAYFIGLYPFLAVDAESHKQAIIKKIARSQLISSLISATVALLGLLPISGSRFIAKISLAKTWSTTALDALCTSLLKYHTMRNVLYMAMTEFEEVPDWEFMREKRNQIAFLYGDDDHWAPLHMHDEIVKQVPDVVVEVEKEGHTHSFCCTVAGSIWVARHSNAKAWKSQLKEVMEDMI